MVMLQVGNKEESKHRLDSQLETGQNLETHTGTLSHCLLLLFKFLMRFFKASETAVWLPFWRGGESKMGAVAEAAGLLRALAGPAAFFHPLC